MKKQTTTPNQQIRLNKFIAHSGVCSRREADKLIESGQIKVNGKIVTELGFSISNKDVVVYKGKELKSQKFVYVLLNKPKGFVTTTKDPHAEKTVMDLVDKATEERIYPVGRLDKDTTGLLLLTNDGDLTQNLTHPSSKVAKVYKVNIDKPLTKKDQELLVEGIELEDGLTFVDELGILNEDSTEIGVEIHSGKNRIIRRMFEHLGYKVKKLDRVLFADLTKKDLLRGKWRLLTDSEIRKLKNYKAKTSKTHQR